MIRNLFLFFVRIALTTNVSALDDHLFSIPCFSVSLTFSLSHFCGKISELLEISTKKTFFPEICYEVLIDLISNIPKKDIFLEHVFPLIKKTFEADPSEYLPETVSLALAIQSQFDYDVFKALAKTPKSLAPGSVLQATNLAKLVPALHASVATLPNLNAVWVRLIAAAVAAPTTSRLADLWGIAVDGTAAVVCNFSFTMSHAMDSRSLPQHNGSHPSRLLDCRAHRHSNQS
jgi:hypothetical protein